MTALKSIFSECKSFCADLSKWDVSNATELSFALLCNCGNFNSDLSSWNVSNVTNLECMLYKRRLLNNGKPISNS